MVFDTNVFKKMGIQSDEKEDDANFDDTLDRHPIYLKAPISIVFYKWQAS